MPRVPHRDPLIAAVLVAAGQAELWLVSSLDAGLGDPRPVAAPLVLVAGGALAWRASRPLAVVAVVAACIAAQGALVAPAVVLAQVAAVLIAVYSVAALSGWRSAVAGLALAVASVMVLALSGPGTEAGEIATIPLFAGAPWAAGRGIRQVRRQARRLAELNRELAEERDRSARLAAAAERARLARELHDVVSHGVGVMTVQAAGASRIAGRDPDRAAAALEAIAGAGREALADLERMVNLLRADDETGEPLAQPGLDDLGELIERTRGAGVRIVLRTEGKPHRVPPGVGLTAYRVVQESLTNAVKHAEGAVIDVAVRYRPERLEIEVADEGGAASSNGGGGGHGLAGMRERVAMYGGELVASARPGQGFSVIARLPLPRAGS